MDFEEIEYPIKAPSFLSTPFNHAELKARFEEDLMELSSRLPLHVCCKGGYPERDTLSVETLEFANMDEESVSGHAVLTFDEYDPFHLTDGSRRARLDFSFFIEANLLLARCREAHAEE
jgi:hypothetical protein